jgi:hypothetical protein
MTYFPLIRQAPHRKWRVKQFLYCCVCIRCRCNVFTQPLPSNNKGIYIYRLVWGIYEVGRLYGLGATIYIPRFIMIGLGFQQLIGEIHRQHGDLISLLSLFGKHKIRLIWSPRCLCVCVCVCVCVSMNVWTNIYEILYVMAPEPISTAYFINPSHQFVCLHVYPPSLLDNGSVKVPVSLLGTAR